MSNKAAQNYEKIVLGVAVLAAAAFGFLGFSKAGAVPDDFRAPNEGRPNDDASVKDAQKVTESKASLAADWAAEPGDHEGRPVDVFVGVPLFKRRDSPNEPFDPRQDKAIHPPIPNKWWLDHNVSMRFADSPQRDDDEDGFSNLEEFEGGTHPADSEEHPELLAKLSYVNDESVEWIVEYGFVSAGKWIPKVKDSKGNTNRVDFDKGLEPGDVFFSDAPMAKRFKFIEIVEKEIENERLNITEKLKFAIFEDLKPNKVGIEYEIPERFPKAQISDHSQWDRTAVLDLQALDLEGKEFKVEERTHFALPPTAESKDYYLKSVTPDEIVVEYGPEGDRKTVTIPKGGLPDMR